MPRLLFLYLFKRIGFGVLVVQFALSVPVVLSYLLYQLPPAAVRGGLVIPALIGVTPTVGSVVTVDIGTGTSGLGDITLRAVETLRAVAAVACEDTRVTGKLLNHLGIKKRMIRYDDHASETDREKLLALIRDEPVALVSDAGTPLISDPGYRLVREARELGIAVTSLPGAIAGGLVIGLVEGLAGFYLPEGFRDIAAYVVVLVTLVIRPNGLFGAAERKKV